MIMDYNEVFSNKFYEYYLSLVNAID